MFSDTASSRNPPLVEGMLKVDSPCVPTEYRRTSDTAYAATQERWLLWDPRDFFATNGPTLCGSVPELGVYRVDGALDRSFRILAHGPGVSIDDISWESAGAPRPLTPADSTRLDLEQLDRERGRSCTLETRNVDEAAELLRFRVETSPLVFRLSRYVATCFTVNEVFLLDAMREREVVAQFRVVRPRARP